MKSLDSFNENRIIDLDGFVFVLGFFFCCFLVVFTVIVAVVETLDVRE